MSGESESDAKAVIIHNNRLCLMPTLACGEVDARARPHIKEFIDSKLCDGVSQFLGQPSYDNRCLVSLPLEVKVMLGPVIVPISVNSLVMVYHVS